MLLMLMLMRWCKPALRSRIVSHETCNCVDPLKVNTAGVLFGSLAVTLGINLGRYCKHLPVFHIPFQNTKHIGNQF